MATQNKVTKLNNSEGAGDTSADDLNPEVIEKIDEVQNSIDQLNEEASEEILRVEQKFNKQRQPLFNQRGDLIKQIPKFWLKTFLNHPQMSGMLSEIDEQILEHLTSLDVQEHEDIKSGYKITFHFSENEWFSEKSLVKEFRIGETGEPVSAAVNISWKPGKNVLETSNQAGQKRDHPSSGESFFAWFDNRSPSVGDECGEVIKDDIWPNPLQYYMANLEDDEDGDEGDLDEEELDEEIEEDEGEEEDA